MYDIAFLSCLPNMVVMCPADEAELVHMVATAAAYDDGPSAVRYPRGNGCGVSLPKQPEILPIGKGRVLRTGEDIALLSIGTRLAACLDAAEKLAADGVQITVADARFAKPLDTGLLAELAQNHKYLLIVEEGSPGGFAAHAINYLANHGHLDDGCRVRSVTLPDMFIDHDSQEGQLADAGLDAAGILHSLHSLRTVAGLDKKSPAKAGKAGAK